jgi:hypothetical protein
MTDAALEAVLRRDRILIVGAGKPRSEQMLSGLPRKRTSDVRVNEYNALDSPQAQTPPLNAP